mmetsp:Transcript_21080/g.39622  ORF Transcript_21080/g.39622 Transcript_21080/m.39622 type:complete len:139 (+) Transcript_21080:99-515(+)
MSEDDVQKFSSAFEDMQKRAQVNLLPLEKKLAQCQLGCYKDMSDGEVVHRCVRGCQAQLEAVGTRIQGEFQGVMGRVKTCEESVKQQMAPKIGAAQDTMNQMQLQQEFQEGVRQCVKQIAPMLPEVDARIKQIITQAL